MNKVIALLIVVIIIILGLYYGLVYKKHDTSATASVTPTPSASSMASETPLPNIVHATIVTTKGNIELDLLTTAAPKTVLNFVNLAKSGFYDGTKFHRVVADFVIQGGDPLSKTDDPNVGRGGPGYTFDDEINPKSLGLSEDVIAQLESRGYKYDASLTSIKMEPGVIAMANAGPSTNGSQFFIVTNKPQPHLDGLHTVFGRVTKGMDVVLMISQGDVVSSITIADK